MLCITGQVCPKIRKFEKSSKRFLKVFFCNASIDTSSSQVLSQRSKYFEKIAFVFNLL